MKFLTLCGTFFPLIGVAATLILALFTHKRLRWIILIDGPLVTAGICYLLSHKMNFHIYPIFVLQFMILLLAMIIYYPLLITIGTVNHIRKTHSRR